jgi:hypothetical protein
MLSNSFQPWRRVVARDTAMALATRILLEEFQKLKSEVEDLMQRIGQERAASLLRSQLVEAVLDRVGVRLSLLGHCLSLNDTEMHSAVDETNEEMSNSTS